MTVPKACCDCTDPNVITDGFRVTTSDQHSCSSVVVGSKVPKPGCDRGKVSHFAPHAYTKPFLAPALRAVLSKDRNATPKACVGDLSSYLVQEPTSSFAAKVKGSCLNYNDLNVTELIANIPAYIELLKKKGHEAGYTTIDAKGMTEKRCLYQNCE